MVNIGNMMKQAQELQKKMSEAQEQLKLIEVEGSSGGGMVKVVCTACTGKNTKNWKKILKVGKNTKVESVLNFSVSVSCASVYLTLT